MLRQKDISIHDEKPLSHLDEQYFVNIITEFHLKRDSETYSDIQAWIQRFKEVSQIDWVQKFPLIAVWTSRYTSVIIFACCVINFNTLWLDVHQCKISWKLHLSGKAQYLKYWLTVISAKHQKICSQLNKVYSH